MRPSEISELGAGLGKDPQGRFLLNRLMQAAVPSNSQKNQQLAYGAKSVKRALLNAGFVQNDNLGGTDIVKGGPNDLRLSQYQAAFAKHMDTLGGSPTNDQIDKEVAKFTQDMVQNQPPTTHWWQFGGGTKGPDHLNMGGDQSQKAAPAPKMNMATARAAVLREYKSAGKLPPPEAQLVKEAHAKMDAQ